MIYNEEGITFADCMREAESLDRLAAEARADGDSELARRLAEEAKAARAFAVVMADPGPSSADDDALS